MRGRTQYHKRRHNIFSESLIIYLFIYLFYKKDQDEDKHYFIYENHIPLNICVRLWVWVDQMGLTRLVTYETHPRDVSTTHDVSP